MKHIGQRAVLQLAGTFLAIIMVMPIVFSLVIYGLSEQEFHRRPSSTMSQQSTIHMDDPTIPPTTLNDYLNKREDESLTTIRINLIVANLLVLIIGGLISYLLAQRTLQPIDDNMAAQTRFVSDASHELRTPLTALLAANEVASMNPKLTLKQARQTIADNVDDVKRLQKLTNSMLGLLKEQKNDIARESVSVSAIVGTAMNMIVNQALEKNIAVQDAAKDYDVLGDRQSLEQLLTILLDNAVKYSKDGGTIKIDSSKKGRNIMISVSDSGIGMSDADREKIFTRFFRTEESRSTTGYGLGLSIAERIIKAHNGKINVDSELDVGSTFTVTLPMAPKKSKKK